MDIFVPLVVSGIVTGSLYFLVAAGLVVVYRLSRILNFAHGSVGMVGAYIFFVGLWPHMPMGLALPLALLASAGLGVFIERFTIRRANRQSSLAAIIVTVGWMTLLPVLVSNITEGGTRVVPQLFPKTQILEWGSLFVTADQLIVLAIAIALGIGFWALLRYTTVGLQMRAVAASPDGAALLGVNVNLVAAVSWGLAGVFAGVAGILISPFINLSNVTLTLLVVPGYAAALAGGLQSVGAAFAGAMVLGIGGALLRGYGSDITGLQDAFPFLLIMLLLIVTREESGVARTV